MFTPLRTSLATLVIVASALFVPSPALAAGTITQVNLSAQVVATTQLTTQINTTGNNGSVTFTTTAGSAFTVGTSGIVAVPATLIPGSYTVSGTDADTSGDTGTWSFTVSVTPANGTITLVYPTAQATAGTTTTYDLVTSGATGPVTFTTTTGSAFSVSSSGSVSIPATLTPGTYTVSGTDADLYGDTGTWGFTVTLVSPALTINPINETGIATSGTPFSSQITVSTPYTPTFSTTTPGQFTVSSTGAVSAPATLTPGTYTASGSISDLYGDSGSWIYTLIVEPATSTITQLPSTTSATVAYSTPYSSTLATTDSNTPITYATVYAATGLSVTSSGQITAPGTLSPGIYTANGTDQDPLGAVGVWSFTLTVSPPPTGALPQVSFTTSPGSAPTPSSTYIPQATTNAPPVSFSVQAAPSVCTISSGVVSLLSPGICTVVATVTSNGVSVSAYQSFSVVSPTQTGPLPAYPQSLSITPGTYSASATWAPSPNASSFSIIYYIVRASPGGYSCTSSTLNCTILGLSPSTSYTFTITATNGTLSSTSPTTGALSTLSVPTTTTTTVPTQKSTSYLKGSIAGFASGSAVISRAFAIRLRSLARTFDTRHATRVMIRLTLYTKALSSVQLALARTRAARMISVIRPVLARATRVSYSIGFTANPRLNQSITFITTI